MKGCMCADQTTTLWSQFCPSTLSQCHGSNSGCQASHPEPLPTLSWLKRTFKTQWGDSADRNIWPPVETPELEPWWKERISSPKQSPDFRACTVLHAPALVASPPTHIQSFFKKCNLKKRMFKLSVLPWWCTCVCNSSTQQPGAGMSQSQGQPEIHSETLCKSKTTSKKYDSERKMTDKKCFYSWVKKIKVCLLQISEKLWFGEFFN